MRYLVLLLAVLCASCTSSLPSFKPYHLDVQQGNVVTSKMMLQLKPGMSKSQVRYVMGTPLLQDSFHQDRWDYLYQMNKGGEVIERRRVILQFKNDGLASVRGDVIAAGSPGAENAPMANITDVKTAKSDKTLLAEDAKASWYDRFKFWKDDEKSVAPISAAKPVEVPQLVAPKVEMAKVAEPVQVVPPAVGLVVEVPQAKVEQSVVAEEPVQTVVNEVPEKVTVGEVAPVDLKAELAGVVAAWAEAWRTKDINAYLKFYSEKFEPEGMTRKTWSAQRKQKIAGQAGKISLELEKVSVNAYPKNASVGFIQHYSNGHFSDDVVKVLSFVRENNQWLIVKEAVVTKPPKLNAKLEKGAKAEAPQAPAVEVYKLRDVTADEKSEAMPEKMIQESASKALEPAPQPVPAAKEIKPVVKEMAPAKVEPAKAEVKAEVSKVESNKDKPLPPEDAPGYFERMLEKIGF